MRLEELAGPGVYELLRQLRPPSFGLPLVFKPPPREDDGQTRVERALGSGSTTQATAARAGGLPGQDRAPGKAAERDNPQGFTKSPNEKLPGEGGY